MPEIPLADRLAPYRTAGVLEPAEAHLAATVDRLVPGTPFVVLLGLALAARGVRMGHTCLALDDVVGGIEEDGGAVDPPLWWPPSATWATALEPGPVVGEPGLWPSDAVPPLVVDIDRLYLQRYWAYEVAVAEDLTRRAGAPPVDLVGLASVLDRLFGTDDPVAPDLQRRAVATALTHRLAVVAGGPGTGKSWTVARLVAAAHLLAGSSAPRVALAAPTGKAAGRLAEALALAAADAEGGEEGALGPEVAAALRQVTVATVHTLLGSTGGLRFNHDRDDPLPYDLVVVDETSMVSLPLMARLLDAVRPEAGVVLVGDPYQLASVEVGTVMGDLVGPEVPASTGPLDGLVTVLSRRYRFAEDSAIAALGDAVRRGDADGALVVLASGAPGVAWVRDDQALAEVEDLLVQAAAETVVAARAGEAGDALAASSRIKLLAATRRGPASVADWASRLEAGVVRRLGQPLRPVGGWFEGRPVLVTANDRANRLRNGDTGVALRRDGRLVVALAEGDDQPRWVPVAALGAVDTWWSMTIHKAQGSEFEHAVVSLPAAGSPALSRELLYTAVTRGRRQVTVVASEEALRQAVERPVSRASGLGRRLWHGVP